MLGPCARLTRRRSVRNALIDGLLTRADRTQVLTEVNDNMTRTLIDYVQVGDLSKGSRHSSSWIVCVCTVDS